MLDMQIIRKEGVKKLLRSEFSLSSDIIQSTDESKRSFDIKRLNSLKALVKEGACLLWCQEILEALIKPHYQNIKHAMKTFLSMARQMQVKIEFQKGDLTKEEGGRNLSSIYQASFLQLQEKTKKKVLPLFEQISLNKQEADQLINELLSQHEYQEDTPKEQSIKNKYSIFLKDILTYECTCKQVLDSNFWQQVVSLQLNVKELSDSRSEQGGIQSILQELQTRICEIREQTSIYQKEINAAEFLFEEIMKKGKEITCKTREGELRIDFTVSAPLLGVEKMLAESDPREGDVTWFNENTQKLTDNRKETTRLCLYIKTEGEITHFRTMYPINTEKEKENDLD